MERTLERKTGRVPEAQIDWQAQFEKSRFRILRRSELFNPGFGFERGCLHARCSTSGRQASMVSRSASWGTTTASGTTQAAGLKGRGTQNRSQLLARHGFLNAMPAPTIGRPVRLPR